MELLRVRTREERGWTVVQVEGQLDVATAPDFRQALVQAQYGGSVKVLVDLDGIEFMDSMGLGVLVGGLKRARTHDGELAVACSRPRLLQLLAITRLDEILHIVADPAELLAG